MPRVSIITRTRNRPALLGRALNSITAQTLADWDLVVVNDGGDPGPVEAAVAALAPGLRPRVRMLHRAASTGMEAASNAALEHCTGDYLAIHDDDDSWLPDFLEATTRYLDAPPHPGVRGVVTHAERVLERIEPEGTVTELERRPLHPQLRAIALARMLEENCFPPICLLVDRRVVAEIGPFDPTLPVLGDWEFALRLLQRHDLGVLPQVLARYHLRAPGAGAYGNTVTDGAARHRLWDRRLRERWLNAAAPREQALGTLAALGAERLRRERGLGAALGE